MNKIKLNTGLASIMLVASIFAGWQCLLLVTILLFAFCDVEETVKNVAVSVITFYVGYTIVSVGWDVIVAAVNVVINAITKFATTFNNYVDPIDYISVVKLTAPFEFILSVVDSIVSVLLTIVKLGFVIAILTGKPAKKNVLSNKIQEYVAKAVNYVNGMFTQSQATQQSVQQQTVDTNIQQ